MAGSETCESKKRKHEEDNEDKAISVLQKFKLVKVLKEDTAKKFVAVEGRIPSESETGDEDGNNKAVLLLEKKPFAVDSIEDLLNSGNTKLTFVNDCYSNYQLSSSKPLHDIKVSLINPATEKHIMKFMAQECFIIHETAEIHKTITLPVIEKQRLAVEWVYNILDKKAEVDKVVFEDPDPENGFMLVPDMKWNGTEIESLYLVALVHKRSLKCIRDLDQSHLPLLKNILKQCPRIIFEKYGLPPCKLRMYCHYEPSYYHFHVHINNIKFDCPGREFLRAYSLSDIIDNIEMKNNYYQEKTLSILVAENSLLYKELKSAGHIDDGSQPDQ